MNIFRKILFPFALIYGAIMLLRNRLYSAGIFKSTSFPVPVIAVGNLTTGGTGKTPMIEYLLQLLIGEYKIAALSRGYGRKTSGFLILSGKESTALVGDEPLQFKQKFPEAIVAVDENRTRGISQLQKMFSPEVVLLDDAFQHRKVNPGLNILLTTYGKFYTDDFLLPTGNLREPAAGASRADIIIVTKAPGDLPQNQQEELKNHLKIEAHQKLFFSYIRYSRKIYGKEKNKELESLAGKKITLVTGIANPAPLLQFLEKNNIVFTHLKYPDHHNFSRTDLEKISRAPFVLTTEKDFMRLQQLEHVNLFYIPIEMKILNRGEEFNKIVIEYIRNEK